MRVQLHQPILIPWEESSAVFPKDGIGEPAVWVRRLQVLKSWAAGEDLCDIQLVKGLNIVWAEPHVPKKIEEGQDGLSGHAAGKSTLCRLIRYALGERKFGKQDFQDSFRHLYPNGWLLVEVVVEGDDWLIRRPLGIGPHPGAVKGKRISEAFGNTIEWGSFQAYMHALGKATSQKLGVKEFPGSDNPILWEHVLAWLSRDQDCRMMHLADWRPSGEETGSPYLSKTEACWVILTVLGLVNQDDLKATAEHEKLIAVQARLRDDLPKHRHHLNESVKRLDSALALVSMERENKPALPPDLERNLIRRKINSELERMPREGNFCPVPAEVRDAEEYYRECQQESTRQEDQLQREKKNLRNDRNRLRELKGEKKVAGKDEWKRGLPRPNDRCNQLLSVAIDEGCPVAQGIEVDRETEIALRQLSQRIESYETAIAKLEDYLGTLEKRVKDTLQKEEEAELCYKSLNNAWIERNLSMATRRTNLQHALSELEYLEAVIKEIETVEKELADLAVDIRESNERQQESRKREKKRRAAFQSRYISILQSVFGKQASGRIHFQNGQIIPIMEGGGKERDSAGIETAKLLAFDFAAMLSGIEGNCLHPRFLIHDSPREADLSVDVYHRFFLLMKRVAEACGNSPNFQYIVTTTEKPPPELRQEPWLRLHLDASKTKGRLLGVDI